MNTDFRHDPALINSLDLHPNSAAARMRLDQLHAEAATRRLVREHRRNRQVPRFRSRLAIMLRRTADLLAPPTPAERSVTPRTSVTAAHSR